MSLSGPTHTSTPSLDTLEVRKRRRRGRPPHPPRYISPSLSFPLSLNGERRRHSPSRETPREGNESHSRNFAHGESHRTVGPSTDRCLVISRRKHIRSYPCLVRYAYCEFLCSYPKTMSVINCSSRKLMTLTSHITIIISNIFFLD